ncbi:hypothetical protein VC83_00303 [Pseudogymnoascus destructans]|uniref:Tyrosinase copper-binding domain-containing protein n=2 Tax=Pseudogymnoascus destructans TaxID=655981 RepID=L8FTG9_PSED2|nr:uncharacterized protein VC83_00303 [Pseudogymnoascus destructans]ELR04250.1 hypothetical protein GMDG_06658 [Pseudogymnoascus destructans 20631-21]OAF63407.1 hypothetical protein VC83_00303 [Pseudogymnoascus destructans]
MVARLKLKEIDGKAPPGVESAAKFDSTRGNSPGPDTIRINTLDGVTANPTPDGFSYNPRCLRRDISENAAVSTRTNATVSLLTTHDNIADFQDYMQDIFAQSILFASSGNPAWLHHANVDRIWWIWQNQDLATRQNAIAGQTHMAGDGVPTTLEDDQFFQVNEKVPKLKDLLTTLGGADGGFCYIYQYSHNPLSR